ncbi:MAG: D-alanine--D-alanine ligase [Candidatus Heteroscillospira sp.]|jgi:D-alanine-D-alanine ligase
MNIVVLCGGLSNERDVSISSGTGVVKALRARGHKAVLVDVFFGYTGSYSRPEEIFDLPQPELGAAVGESLPDLAAVRASRKQSDDSLVGENVVEICRAADITFLALHGEEGENGKLQAFFDIHGIRYTGCGYLGSAIAMNKGVTKSLLQTGGVSVPGGIRLKRGETPYGNVGFPCVVKPCSGGSSVGTYIVSDSAEYEEHIEMAFAYEDELIVEQYIRGRELTVGVMDGEAMPVIEIIPKSGFYDYKNKYQAGFTEELCPAPLTAEETERVQREAEKVNRLLLIDAYCRVDFLMDGNGTIFCLEANTLPGMTPTSLIPQMAAAQGMDFGELCEKIIEVSEAKYL